MSASSEKSSQRKQNLAMDPGVIDRIGVSRYRLIKLWVADVNGRYEDAIAPHVNRDTVLLDAGCSRGDPDIPSLERAGHAVGCDVDMAGLRANVLVRDRVFAPLDALPFVSGAFDAILCKFVIEHLANPLAVFREFMRVLRPGGIVAVLTPNRYSPFAVMSGLIPHPVKAAFKGFLFGGHDEDTFPTYYRANTPGRLDALMQEAGFRSLRLEMLAGMWAFFIFIRPLALAVRAVERAAMYTPGLRRLSTHMLGVWQKPLTAGAS
ncbi:MAG: methyltransferase domain-containing protein [Candidatus Hydrogenedentes bacterium]|nr:methyltransferase domain-containing protein [Candidatus Hydrogenedentota bacterium]